jgi:hypothetical protein
MMYPLWEAALLHEPPVSGMVNLRLDQGAIPMRFSTDPATLFLPVLQKNP